MALDYSFSVGSWGMASPTFSLGLFLIVFVLLAALSNEALTYYMGYNLVEPMPEFHASTRQYDHYQPRLANAVGETNAELIRKAIHNGLQRGSATPEDQANILDDEAHASLELITESAPEVEVDLPEEENQPEAQPDTRSAFQILQEVVEEVETVLKDRKSTRLNSSHRNTSRMPSSA